MAGASHETLRHTRSASHGWELPTPRKTHSRGSSLQSFHSSPSRSRRGSIFQRGMLGKLGGVRHRSSSSSLAGSEFTLPEAPGEEGLGAGEDFSNFRWDDDPISHSGELSPRSVTSLELAPMMPSLTHSRGNSSSSDASSAVPRTPAPFLTGHLPPMFEVALPHSRGGGAGVGEAEAPPKVPAKDPYATFSMLPPPPRILQRRASQDSLMTSIEQSLARLATSARTPVATSRASSDRAAETVDDVMEGDRPAPYPDVPLITRSSLPDAKPQPVRIPSHRFSQPHYRPVLSTIAPSPDVSCEFSAGDLSGFASASSVADSSASSQSGPFGLAHYLPGQDELRPIPARHNSRSRVVPAQGEVSPTNLSPQMSPYPSSQPVTPSSEGEGEQSQDRFRDYFGLTSSPAVRNALAKLEGAEEDATKTYGEEPAIETRTTSARGQPASHQP